MSVVGDMKAIAAECRRLGLTVKAMPGWEGRGLGPLDPAYIVCHHTAATRDVDRILRDGRSDLHGPLCNFALHADGTVVLVAAGRANHAGRGVVRSGESYGIEATGPPFANVEAYVRLVTAIRRHHHWDSDRVVAHKEIARPLGRKVDPSLDMDTFRAHVSLMLGHAAPATEEDDMPLSKAEVIWLRKLSIDGRKDARAALSALESRLGARFAALEQRIEALQGGVEVDSPEAPEGS